MSTVSQSESKIRAIWRHCYAAKSTAFLFIFLFLLMKKSNNFSVVLKFHKHTLTAEDTIFAKIVYNEE